MKAYLAAHPVDRRAYKAAYDAAHKADSAAYRAANAERIKAQKATYYKANRTSILLRVKARDAANPDRVSAYHADHYRKNADKIKSNVSAYRRANPEKKTYLENRRRARKTGNGGSHTFAERREKFASLGSLCIYCGSFRKLTGDHLIPLSRGGTDDIENIAPACRSCNSQKGSKTFSEFIGRIL